MGYQGLDQMRAAGAGLLVGTTTTVGDEPLIVDIPLPQKVGWHWIVEGISFLSVLSLRFPAASGNSPLSGLFLCPPATPLEVTADLATIYNMQARGVQVPLADPYLDSAILGGGKFALSMNSAAGFKMTCPLGWSVRAEVVCAIGAAPGPGIGSIGRLWVMCYQEQDQC